MRIKPGLGNVVGEATDTRWSQVLTTPNAYAVIEVADADGIARNHGVRLMAKLTHALETPPVSLKEVEALVEKVKDEGTVSLCVIVPVGTVCYIVVSGTGLVAMKRGNLFATLISKQGAVSGEVKKGDTIVMATESVVRALPKEELAQTFDHLPAADAAEKLTLLLHQKPESRGGAALVFQVVDLTADEYRPPADAADESLPDEDAALPVIRPSFISRVKLRIRERRLPTLHGVLRRGKTLLRNRKTIRLALVLAAALVFAGSVILGTMKQSGNTFSKELESAYLEAKQGLDEGLALLELNPVKSRERLKAALDALSVFETEMNVKSKEAQKLTEIRSELTKAYQSVYKRYEVKPEVFYDVSLLKKDAKVKAVSLYENYLTLLDTNGTTVYVVDITSKRGEIIGGGTGIAGATLVAAGPDAAFALTPQGVYEMPYDGSQTRKPVIESVPEWGNIGSMTAYADNLYLLDTNYSRIWKYQGSAKGFSELREYLNPDTLPDFQNATGMAIDGSVWVGLGQGDVRKFISGQDVTFVITGVDPPLAGPTFVYTDDTLAHLYVSDPAANRIVVLTKEGTYVAQYAWGEGLPLSRFVVSESAHLILILSGGMIYSVPLI